MKQPFQALSKITQWCEANGAYVVLTGSWALLLQGVTLPEAPRDLDLAVRDLDFDKFHAENPWIVQRRQETVGRMLIPEDDYVVDMIPARVGFQHEAIDRADSINWGTGEIKLMRPLDILLFKLGHDYWDDRGEATCCAIVKWWYAQKPFAPEEYLNLDGSDPARPWMGPVRSYRRDG